MPRKPPPASTYDSSPASCSGSSTSPPPVRKTTALYLPSFLALVKTEPSSVASVLKRPAAGPARPMASMASIPAFTIGDSSVAEAWNTRTLTFWPPGGDGSANAVGDASGGLAVAAVPPSRDAAMVPATRTAAAPRLDLDR